MSEEARMKKTIIKIAVCVVVFIASAFIIGGIMNQGHNNMTMEMAPATLPVITMESGDWCGMQRAAWQHSGNGCRIPERYRDYARCGQTGKFYRGYLWQRNHGNFHGSPQH